MNEHPSAGRFDGREHRLAVRVYYEDTDFTGVVYHAAHVRFFERGRSDCLRLAGINHGELAAHQRPTAFAVTRLEVDFHKAAHIDDALEVRTLYQRVRGARLFVSQAIWRGETLIATAEVVAACIDLAGRARKPSKALLDAVAPLLAEAP